MAFIGNLAEGLSMAGKQGVSVLRSIAAKGQAIRKLESVAQTTGATVLGIGKSDWSQISNAMKAQKNATSSMNHLMDSGNNFGGSAYGFSKTGFNSTSARLGIAREAVGNWWSGKSLSGIGGAHTAQRAALRQAAVYGGGIAVGANMIFGGHRRRR